MLFVVCALSFLSLLADHRVLSKEEAHAFRTLYGTDDMAQLKEIERDPQKFWRERVDALRQKGATMSHVDFCAKFVQEAKECIMQDCPEEKKSLLPQRFEYIERLIQENLPEDSPVLPNAKAGYYGDLCDKMRKNPQDVAEVIFNSEEKTRQGIHWIVNGGFPVTNKFNTKVRWIVSKDGQFSIFDYLVMRSQGFYLCGASENPQERFDFCAHDGDFTGWWGLFEHDAYSHSAQQYRIDEALDGYSISSQKYFNVCCNPERFSPGDLIGMSHKVLGWFYQFHELPSLIDTFCRRELCSLIFPHAGNPPGHYNQNLCWAGLAINASGTLSDAGFLDIVPYFMHVPRDYDWHKNPLQCHPTPPDYDDEKHVHEALLGWRAQNCTVGFEFLPAQRALNYFRAFYFHFSFITPPDVERDSHFFREMLDYLYRAEQALEKAKRFVCFSDFEQKVETDVQEFLRQVTPMEGDLLVEAPSYFIFILNTKYAAQCKKIADEGRRFVFKHSEDAFHVSVRRLFCVPPHLEMTLNVAVDDEPVSLEQGLRKKAKIT